MHIPGGKSPRGHLPRGENPHPTNRVTFSDTCEHALHLKSSIRELVVDEKAPSNVARAGDAVRPAQLLRDRHHHGRARVVISYHFRQDLLEREWTLTASYITK